jgi:putative transposase
MKKAVDYVTAYHDYSERRACALTRQHRSTQRKPSRRDPRLELRQRMHEIAQIRIHYECRRIQIMLWREGWPISLNLVYRLYREEGLALRSKRPRWRKIIVHREARVKPSRPNQVWSLDFVHDQLSGGQKFRILKVVDVYSREGLATEVDYRLRAENVVEVLNRLVRQRGAPKFLFVDNAFIETFNGSLRDECLNLHWFDNLAEAKRLIEAWRIDYNVSRPHMGIGNIPPREYALQVNLLEKNTGSDAARN